MNNTLVNYEPITYIKNRAYGTKLKDDKYVIYDQGRDTATIGDGGIYSCVNDLNIWLDFLRKSKKQNSYYYSKRVVTDENTTYSCGLHFKKFKNYNIIYHCGETIGTNTIIGFIPKRGIKFIILTNLDNIDTALFIENLVRTL